MRHADGLIRIPPLKASQLRLVEPHPKLHPVRQPRILMVIIVAQLPDVSVRIGDRADGTRAGAGGHQLTPGRVEEPVGRVAFNRRNHGDGRAEAVEEVVLARLARRAGDEFATGLADVEGLVLAVRLYEHCRHARSRVVDEVRAAAGVGQFLALLVRVPDHR